MKMRHNAQKAHLLWSMLQLCRLQRKSWKEGGKPDKIGSLARPDIYLIDL